jgi:xanthine dehydrogenase accessory factor
VNCDAVVETRRSHTLGRVYWNGTSQPDSGKPEGDPRRVLRAPAEGLLTAKAKIGDHIEEGQVVAVVSEQCAVPGDHAERAVVSTLKGVLRGLIRGGIDVTKGLKIGDVDPRDDESACYLVSDKALSIGGAVLEAILTREDIRKKLWGQGI